MRSLPPWGLAALSLLATLGRGGLHTAHNENLAAVARGSLDQLSRIRLENLFYLLCDPSAPQQALSDRIWQTQVAELRGLLVQMREFGAHPILFKGADFSLRHYGDRSLGMADIDLLVRRTELGTARAALFTSGFRQGIPKATGGWEDFDPVDLAKIELAHFELVPFTRMTPLALDPGLEALLDAPGAERLPVLKVHGVPHVLTTIDLHHGVMLGLDIDPLFDRIRPGPLPGSFSLSATDHFWLCACRSYVEALREGMRSLRHYAYLIPHARTENTDWSLLLSECHRTELAPAFFYYLRTLEILCGRTLAPDAVVQELRAAAAIGCKDNLGWPLAQQLGCVFDPPLDVDAVLEASLHSTQRATEEDPAFL